MHVPSLGDRIVFPFRIGLEPMMHLLVASFEGDPEFTALEPQRFDDPLNGTGLRVLRYRKDGRVDVYWEPGVRVDRREISIGAGIADFAEARMEPARFEISSDAVQVQVAFVDQQGREVALEVAESASPAHRFPFLAPVGNDVLDPQRLFLVHMLGFDFIRREGTSLSARIGERRLEPGRFPIRRGGRSVFFARYAAEPIIAFVNPPMDAPVVASRTQSSGMVHVDGMALSLEPAGAIERVAAGAEPRAVAVDFRPAFPNLADLVPGTTARGCWGLRIAGDPITGGTYALSRAGDTVSAGLDVTEPWRPSGLPLSFRVFTRLVRSFRRWPTTYAWSGTVRLAPEPTLAGGWRRKA